MSASQRKLARLPLEVYTNLMKTEEVQPLSPQDLRLEICEKLKRFRGRARHGGTVAMSVKTVGDLLRVSRRTLLNALDPLLTYGEIELFLKRVSRQCSATPLTTLQLLNQTSKNINSLAKRASHESFDNSRFGDQIRCLPTGIRSLDRRGVGGVRVGSVTELVGRAGAGKTQFALQLILMAAKLNQGAIYIDTEKKLMLSRLEEMARRRLEQNYSDASADRVGDVDHLSGNPVFGDGGEDGTASSKSPEADTFLKFKEPRQVLQNLTLKQPSSTMELLKVLENVEEEVLHRNQHSKFPVRVLILDSIAAPLKRDFGADAAPQRAATLFSITQMLKRYADQLHLAVVVINQVGIDNNENSVYSRRPNQVNVKAALGTSWHHCVSTRLLLDHAEDPHRDGGSANFTQQSQLRTLTVAKSNTMPFSEFHFEISPIGIVQVSRSSENTIPNAETR